MPKGGEEHANEAKAMQVAEIVKSLAVSIVQWTKCDAFRHVTSFMTNHNKVKINEV